MEVSALKYSGGIGLHGRSPLLRLQSDERLVSLTRRGNTAAFEVLVSRFESRLLAFCRHLLGSREDAEDVLQEVLAAAFNAMLADDRPINVRPWLYRIARNRSLNHLRRVQALASDTMDIHLSDHGASTADKVHDREEFRLLVGDIHQLPETQRTALVLREMDALSYEQIAEAMETTVPSVKSLLVRARVSLAEASQARLLSCEEVRIELGEVAEGLMRKPSVLVRRHLRACDRCSAFKLELKETNKALAAVMPISTIVVLKKLLITHLGHSASSSATASSAGAAGSSAAAGSVVAGSSGGVISAGFGAVATKAAAGLAAAALVTGAAVEVEHAATSHSRKHSAYSLRTLPPLDSTPAPAVHHRVATHHSGTRGSAAPQTVNAGTTKRARLRAAKKGLAGTKRLLAATPKSQSFSAHRNTHGKGHTKPHTSPPGRTQVQNDPTVLNPPANGGSSGQGGSSAGQGASSGGASESGSGTGPGTGPQPTTG